MLRRSFLLLPSVLLVPPVLFGSSLATAPTAAAQASAQPEVDRIVAALTPRRRRGATGPAVDPKALEVVERLKTVRTKRGMSHREREELHTAVSDMPQMDFEILFDFNSAVISAADRPKLDALGQALNQEQFKASTIVIGGHTDRKGAAALNQTLSEQRADAVGKYLTDNHKIEPTRLLTTGYGFSKLKAPAKPFAPENRRVQIVNAAG